MIAEKSFIPTLKATLSTTVDAFTPQAQDLPLTSRLGKRRMFRNRIWPETTDPTQERRVRFFPGWLSNTDSGRVCMVTNDVIPAGMLLDTYIEQTQERYGVHLWLAPIKLPTFWPRGNWYWHGVISSDFTLADVLHAWKGELKAVAA